MKALFFLFLFGSPLLINCQIDISKGLIAYYRFTSDKGYDSSIEKNNGTVIGNPIYVADRFGKEEALYFDGQNDYILVPNSPSLTPKDEISICVWIKSPNLFSRFTPIIHKGGENLSGWANRAYSFQIQDNFNVLFSSAGDGFEQNYHALPFPKDDSWHLVTSVVDRKSTKTMKLYLDTMLLSTISDGYSTFNKNIHPLTIAYWQEEGPVAQYFDGYLDDIRIYNRVINIEEIKAIYSYEDTTSITPDLKPFSIFPNPFQEYIKIEGVQSDLSVVIYDEIGRYIMRSQVSASNNIIDTERLVSGLYILTLQDKQGNINYFKLIKQN